MSQILLAIAAAVTAAADQSAPIDDSFRGEMSLPSAERKMVEHASLLAPHIHLFQAANTIMGVPPIANEVLIEQRDGLVLVDAGKTRGAGQRIVALIKSISAKPVKAVIITHWHQDHALGLGPIVETWPNVKIIATAETKQHLLTEPSYNNYPHSLSETHDRDVSRTRDIEGYAREYGPNIHDPKLSAPERSGWAELVGVGNKRIRDEQGTYQVLPTDTFTDHYLIDDPDYPVEALVIGRGHSNGEAVAWLPKQRIVATGDLVVTPVPFGGSHVLEWPNTLRKLKGMQPRMIVPGHGLVQQDSKYVDLMVAAMEEFIAKARALPPGLTDEQVAARADVSSQRSLFANGDGWRGALFDMNFGPDVVQAYHELGLSK